MQTFLAFLRYNNAVPVAVSIMLLGAGGAFAATNPDAIYSSQEQIVSIDNSYIANKDLSQYSPRVEITGVTEDSDSYYVAYNFYTIDLKGGAWQDVTKNEVMIVSKADLGQYRDLGLYVTEQLKQKTERELAYLTEVQGIERKNVTNKVVATQYGGLIGKLLDTKTQELPGYTPVITPPPTPVLVSNQNLPNQQQSPSQTTSAGNPSLSVQVLGNNPAQIPMKASYADLGVVASDNQNSNIRIETYLDNSKVSQIQINTDATSTHIVRYVAIDPSNNSVSAERTIIVYDPAIGPPVPASQVQNGSTPAAGSSSNSGGAATNVPTQPSSTGSSSSSSATTTSVTTTTTATATTTQNSATSTNSTTTVESTIHTPSTTATSTATSSAQTSASSSSATTTSTSATESNSGVTTSASSSAASSSSGTAATSTASAEATTTPSSQ